jgi:sulfate adenylyltransferase subunit 2
MQVATPPTLPSDGTDLFGLDQTNVWNTEMAFQQLRASGQADTKPTAERWLYRHGILPKALTPDALADELGRPANALIVRAALAKARSQRKRVLFLQLYDLPTGQPCLHANDARRARYWLPLVTRESEQAVSLCSTIDISGAIATLGAQLGKDLALFAHGPLVELLRDVPTMGEGNDEADRKLEVSCADAADQSRTAQKVTSVSYSVPHSPAGLYPPVLHLGDQWGQRQVAGTTTPHLKRLEAESIHIIREAVAEAKNPVLLYSIGKDSSALLHLIRKSFYPSPPPLPLLHVDTRWKFQEMYLFRDHMAKVSGLELLLHTNPDVVASDINPFDHSVDVYINATKVEGLKQAIDHHQFDVLFGGARRDEEKSRAKERIFSFRSPTHRWNPKQQRPELWNLYNTKKNKGESIRVFPLSNWTELDIWQYIYLERIPVVVGRDKTICVVLD